MKTRLVLSNLPAALCALFVTGCGGGGGGGGTLPPTPSTDPAFDFSRNRNATTSQIEPVINESGTGFDATEVDSPAIAVDTGRPNGDEWLLYYEATSSSGSATIGVVSSNDDDFDVIVAPRRQAVGLGGSGSGFDLGATDPTVIVNPAVAFGVDGRYRMWFEGRSGSGGTQSSIITASSADGLQWSGFTICTGLTASFAPVRIADPTVLRDGTMFRMWFEAVATTRAGGADGVASIGHAASPDGVAWTVLDASASSGLAAAPVFVRGAATAFDAFAVHAPNVVEDSSVAASDPRRFWLFYEAADIEAATESTIGVAFSADGFNWTRPSLPIFVPSSGSIVPMPFDSGDIEHPTAFLDLSVPRDQQGFILLYYAADNAAGSTPNRIGLARGR